MKKNQLFILFLTLISVCFFSFESKAVSGYKSAPQDTCVTIKMKDGNEISAVIVEKTAQKVRFRKCGSEVTDTVFFVPMNKIESISSLKSDSNQDNVLNKEDESSLRKIKNLIIASYGSSLLLAVIILFATVFITNNGLASMGILGIVLSVLLYLASGITAIFALTDLIKFKKKFYGKNLMIGLMAWKTIGFILGLLSLILLLFI
jgi:tetrahydromethanopterin S-methyltransferase subunit F/ATP-dependent Zn protease